MDKYLVCQLTESKIIDWVINFEIVLAKNEKDAKIKYAKNHKLSKHYALVVGFHFNYLFHQKDVWGIYEYGSSKILKLTYNKLKVLNLTISDSSESRYKSHLR